MTCYDLHTHSTASDGALSPRDLVLRAAAQGVDVLALTDHDGLEGLAEAQAAADEHGIVFIPGVEISVTWHGTTVHIVGLQVDPRCAALQNGLQAIRDYRWKRAEQIAHKLAQAGIAGALEGAKRYASQTLLGRVHFAKFLVAQGLAADVPAVFDRYLVRNKPGYVAGTWATLEQAVEWITQAGGQAVIAHPARYKMTATKLARLIDAFQQAGGVGIEVASGKQHPEQVKHLAQLAQRHQLLASCGSDFHDPDKPWTELGKITPLPRSVTPIWQAWPQAASMAAASVPA